MKDLSRLIRDTQFLPPAFQIVPRLLLLLDDAENASTDELEKLIRVDAGLTTNLLAACNSAWFGAGSRAETLSDAIMRLGFHEVYRLLLKVISLPLLTKPQPDYGLDEANLWNHSLAVATAARFLSQARGQNEDLAFTAGLLHDVGKIAFTQIFKGEYQQLVLQSTSQQRPLTTIEKEHADLNHAEAGAELLSKWNFPENILAAVRFHHDPMKAGAHCELAALVHTANLLAFYINQGSGHQCYALFFDRACLDLLGLTPEMIEEFTPKIETAFEKELAAFL